MKTCPFCGKKLLIIEGYMVGPRYAVNCTVCGARGPFYIAKNVHDLNYIEMQAWNLWCKRSDKK